MTINTTFIDSVDGDAADARCQSSSPLLVRLEKLGVVAAGDFS